MNRVHSSTRFRVSIARPLLVSLRRRSALSRISEAAESFLAGNGGPQSDREARNPPSAPRNVGRFGRREQFWSARAAWPRSGGKNVLAMPCDRQERSKPARWRPCL